MNCNEDGKVLKTYQSQLMEGIEITGSQRQLGERIGLSQKTISLLLRPDLQIKDIKTATKEALEERLPQVLERLSRVRIGREFLVGKVPEELKKISPYYKHLEKLLKSLLLWGTSCDKAILETWNETLYPELMIIRSSAFSGRNPYPYYIFTVFRISSLWPGKTVSNSVLKIIIEEFIETAIQLYESPELLRHQETCEKEAGLYNNYAVALLELYNYEFSTDRQHKAVEKAKKYLKISLKIKYYNGSARTALTIADIIEDYQWAEEIIVTVKKENNGDFPSNIKEDINDPSEFKNLKKKKII